MDTGWAFFSSLRWLGSCFSCAAVSVIGANKSNAEKQRRAWHPMQNCEIVFINGKLIKCSCGIVLEVENKKWDDMKWNDRMNHCLDFHRAHKADMNRFRNSKIVKAENKDGG